MTTPTPSPAPRDVVEVVKELQAMLPALPPGKWHVKQEDGEYEAGLPDCLWIESLSENSQRIIASAEEVDAEQTLEFIAKLRNAFPAIASHLLDLDARLRVAERALQVYAESKQCYGDVSLPAKEALKALRSPRPE